LNSGNACYHSVQNFLSSRLLSKNVKVKIYKTIILPVLLLEAVASERLVKTEEAGKCLTGTMVISKLWRLAAALKLLVVPNRVYKWSINLFPNPNHVYNHPYT
jgi:hypothetical protein